MVFSFVIIFDRTKYEICDCFPHVSLSSLFIKPKMLIKVFPRASQSVQPTTASFLSFLHAIQYGVPTINGGSYVCIYVTV